MGQDLSDQITKIRTYERGLWASQVIHAGLRFGLLQSLNDSLEGYTPAELAVERMLHEPFVRVWCQTAYHFELLDSDDYGRFKLQPFLDQALGLDVFSSLAAGKGALPDPGLSFLRENDPLSLYARSGKTIPLPLSFPPIGGRFPATRNLMVLFQAVIFPQERPLVRLLEKGCTLLEIGCGSGHLLLDLARRFKNSRFTAIDPDEAAISQAEEAVETLGLEDRVSFLRLGGEKMEFQETFDAVLMVLTLHEILPDLRPQVLSRVWKALKPGGELWVLDYPFPDRLVDFRNPRFEYGVIEQYFEAPYGIVHLSAEGQERLLSQAGFGDLKRRPVGEGGRLDFFTSRKRAERLEKKTEMCYLNKN